MTQNVVTGIAALGVAGQVLAALLLVLCLLYAAGLRGPLDLVRGWLWGYELWAAFVVAAVATGGSLFFSEVAHFVPCELCWFQRICMYPLSLLLLFLAFHADNRVARYLLPFPVVGGGVSIYHLLVEHGVVKQTLECSLSAPGGCATKWIEKFGYVTIPTLALTGFVLLIEFLVLAALGEDETATVPDRA
ncbi:MAG TPA: disulfide bond formation protein B [Gaiellaceae bacterium]|nr:disulfide bond formation protein B [Gaiellaceae bacterium]